MLNEPGHRGEDHRAHRHVRIVAAGPLPAAIRKLLGNHVEILPWTVAAAGSPLPVDGVYTYDRPRVDGRPKDTFHGDGWFGVGLYAIAAAHLYIAAEYTFYFQNMQVEGVWIFFVLILCVVLLKMRVFYRVSFFKPIITYNVIFFS